MKLISLLLVTLPLVSCSDMPINLDRSDTLHPQGDKVTDMECTFCSRKEYDDQSGLFQFGKCQETCLDSVCRGVAQNQYEECGRASCNVRQLTMFEIDPVSTIDGQAWTDDSLITLSERSKQWKTLFNSQSASIREKALKKEICSAPAPSLSQTFYLTYPDAPENTPLDQWAQTRQAMVGLEKVKLKRFFYYQAVEPKSNLSCFKENLETSLAQDVQGQTYKSVMDYQRPNDILSVFVVRLGDSADLQIALGPLTAKTAKFESANETDNYQRFSDALEINSDEPALFQDEGESQDHRRALAIRRLWEIAALKNHYVFLSSGNSVADSIQARDRDWKTYLLNNVTVKSETTPGNQTIKFISTLDLSGFCKGAEPLYDLTSH